MVAGVEVAPDEAALQLQQPHDDDGCHEEVAPFVIESASWASGKGAAVSEEEKYDAESTDNDYQLSSSVSHDPETADERRRKRCGLYRSPAVKKVVNRFKNSTKLAFASHACFTIASLFYVKLAFDELAWYHLTGGNDDDDALTDRREAYWVRYRVLYTSGAVFFLLVGVLDWMRYCDVMNVFMILAGAAGVVSGLSESDRAADIWDCVSVHLYLLEAYNLFGREHEHGHFCFRFGDLCFLLGCILDVSVSFLICCGLVFSIQTDLMYQY